MTTTFILCGGIGSRLRDVLTRDCPKAMVEVAGKPFTEYILMQLAAQGFKEVVFCTGIGHDRILNYFRNGSQWDVKISYSHETEPLGTAGALRGALCRYPQDGAFLVMNGDTFFDVELKRLVDSDYDITVALARVDGRFDVPDWDNEGGLVFNRSYYVNSGVLSIFGSVPDSLRDAWTMEVDGFFTDIGTKESYAELCANPQPMLDALASYKAVCR